MQEMESRYETISSMGDEFIKFIRIGLIPIHLTTYKVVYEEYKKQLQIHSDEPFKAVKNTAIDYDLQIRQVYRIIEYMSTSFQTQ